jgi:tetratricopeptide (TPR) repeat protein
MVRALVFALAAYAATNVAWYQSYESGIEHIRRGEAAAARADLEDALAARPEPGMHVRTYGMSFVDYLPHLYLAIACQMEGDIASARDYLRRAEADGLAAQSEVGRPLLEAYRLLLADASTSPETAGLPPPVQARRPEPANPAGRGSLFTDVERRPEVLSDLEYQEVQRHVLTRCQLSAETPPRDAPWYFHYELGLELERLGDPQRALDALLEAVTRRHTPQRQARIYGMWFKDYLPYFAIARLQATLGNWQCVADALALSRQTGEVAAGDEELIDFDELATEARAHGKPN